MSVDRNNARIAPYVLLAAAIVATVAGCSDRGAELGRVVEPEPIPGSPPLLTALVPARTAVGDTVRIAGAGFGSEQTSRVVLFPASSSGTISAAVIAWTADTVRVLVPAGAGDGSVVVQDADSTSNGLAFETAPRLVPYSDVDYIFVNNCTVCHATHGATPPSVELDLSSWAGLMAGSSGGPGPTSGLLMAGVVVNPRHSAESALVQRLNPSLPGGVRMPQWDPAPLSDSLILLISDWVDQGARP